MQKKAESHKLNKQPIVIVKYSLVNTFQIFLKKFLSFSCNSLLELG